MYIRRRRRRLLVFLLPLSPASISLAYTISAAYLTILSKTKINENFSFREIEADEISLRFRVFFRSYRSTEITRIKIIFQIVDGEIIPRWRSSCARLCGCVDMKSGKQRNKLQRSNFAAFKLTSQHKLRHRT